MNTDELQHATMTIAEVIQNLISQDDDDVWADVYSCCEGFITEMVERHTGVEV